MQASSQEKTANALKADRYCVAGLVALSIALLVLSVGVFLLNPVSAIGLISTGLGVACALLCILFFALYNHYLRLAESAE